MPSAKQVQVRICIGNAVHRMQVAARQWIDLRPLAEVATARARPLLVAEFSRGGVERVAVFFTDRHLRRKAVETMWLGTIDRCNFKAADVIERARQLHACGIVVAHNHPSGDPNPSPRDIEATTLLVHAGARAGIAVFDHLIVATDGVVSLRERGLM